MSMQMIGHPKGWSFASNQYVGDHWSETINVNEYFDNILCVISEKLRPKSVVGEDLEGPDLFMPTTNVIDTATFCTLFPFHVVFDGSLKIIQYGIKMQTMSGTILENYGILFKLYPHRASAARSIEMHCDAPKWVPDPFWSVTIYLMLNLTLPLTLDARCGYSLRINSISLPNYNTLKILNLRWVEWITSCRPDSES